MSNPGTPPTPRPEALKKLAQIRIERLKKEEEEEQWISGEELYTEGSSDEDDAAVRAKRKGNERDGKGLKKHGRGTTAKTKKQSRDLKVKSQATLSPPDVRLTSDISTSAESEKMKNLSLEEKDSSKTESEAVSQETSGSELATSSSLSVDEDDEETREAISWRPKRGSIKLPNLTTEGRIELLTNIQM